MKPGRGSIPSCVLRRILARLAVLFRSGQGLKGARVACLVAFPEQASRPAPPRTPSCRGRRSHGVPSAGWGARGRSCASHQGFTCPRLSVACLYFSPDPHSNGLSLGGAACREKCTSAEVLHNRNSRVGKLCQYFSMRRHRRSASRLAARFSSAR